MKTATQVIIRLALTVQFLGVLAVPTLLAAAQAPKGTWMAEWLRSDSNERTMGVLTLRDGKLSFAQDVGDVGWVVELANVKRVAPSADGRALVIQTIGGRRGDGLHGTGAGLAPIPRLATQARVLAIATAPAQRR